MLFTKSGFSFFWKILFPFFCLHLIFFFLQVIHDSQLLFPNSDFERGSLLNWNARGRAFLNQPTFGDNPFYHKASASHMTGNYFVGTFEDRPSAKVREGRSQPNELSGALESVPFVIKRNRISFLLGAGDFSENESVSLVVDGVKVLNEKGRGILSRFQGESMRTVLWDVSRWKGHQAALLIRDNAIPRPGSHINVDDFKYDGFF